MSAHNSLPACHLCDKRAWKSNDVIMGGMTQCFYSCATQGCSGRAAAFWCGLGLLVLFDQPLSPDGHYSIPEASSSWVNSAVKVIRTADINECVHCDKAPPATLRLPPAPGGALHFAGDNEWLSVGPGASLDIAHLFAARVHSLRGRT